MLLAHTLAQSVKRKPCKTEGQSKDYYNSLYTVYCMCPLRLADAIKQSVACEIGKLKRCSKQNML